MTGTVFFCLLSALSLATVSGTTDQSGSARENTRYPTGTKNEEGVVEKYQRPTERQIKEKLTPLQYRVTRREGTEPAQFHPSSGGKIYR